LPTELIAEIFRHVSSWKEASSLLLLSKRLYPIIGQRLLSRPPPVSTPNQIFLLSRLRSFLPLSPLLHLSFTPGSSFRSRRCPCPHHASFTLQIMLVKCLSLSSSSLISLSLGYLHNFSFSDSEMKALRNLKLLKHLDMYDLGAGLVLDLLDAFPSLVSLTTRNTLVGRREHVWFSERSLPQPTMRADAYPTILYRDKSKKFQADHGLKHFLPSSLRYLHLPPTSTGCIVPLLASLIRVGRNTDIPLALPPLISLTINTKEVDQGEAAVLSPLLQAIAPTIEKLKICGASETSEVAHSSLYEELRNCPKLQELELRAFHLPDWEAGKDFGPFTPSIVNLSIVECGGEGMNANLWIASLASSLASQSFGFGEVNAGMHLRALSMDRSSYLAMKTTTGRGWSASRAKLIRLFKKRKLAFDFRTFSFQS
ncbi:hypothetical protein BT69DRAFT_591410, partial [Atractiella rhizophila]